MAFGGAPAFGATVNANPFGGSGSFGPAATSAPFGGVQASPTGGFPGQTGGAPAFGSSAFGRPINSTPGVSGSMQAPGMWNSTSNLAASSFGTTQTTTQPVQNACSHWNEGRCRFGTRCRQRHVCAKCGSSAHTSRQCSSAGAATNSTAEYRPSRIVERNNNGSTTHGTIHHVEAMPEHRGSSAEQIRHEARSSNNNFNSPVASTAINNNTMFNNNNNNNNSNTMFGGNNNNNNTNLFGGNNNTSGTNLFGNNTNTNTLGSTPTSWPGTTTTPLVSTPTPGPNPFGPTPATNASSPWPAPQPSTPGGSFAFNPQAQTTPAPAPAAPASQNMFSFPQAQTGAPATGANPFSFTPTTAAATSPTSAFTMPQPATQPANSLFTGLQQPATTTPAASPLSSSLGMFNPQSAPAPAFTGLTRPAATQPANSLFTGLQSTTTTPAFSLTPPAQSSPLASLGGLGTGAAQNASQGSLFGGLRPPVGGGTIPQIQTPSTAPTLFPSSTSFPSSSLFPSATNPSAQATTYSNGLVPAANATLAPPKVNSSPYGKPLESSKIISASREVVSGVSNASPASTIGAMGKGGSQLSAWATHSPRRVYMSRAPLPAPSRISLRPRGSPVRREEWMLQPASKPRELIIRAETFETPMGGETSPAVLSIAEKDEFVEPAFILTESAKNDGYSCEYEVQGKKLRDFRVTRQGFGSVRWLQPVDATHLNGIDVARVVRIERGAVYMYDEASGVSAPRSGEGLKTRAEVTLLRCTSKKDTEESRKKFEAKVVQQTRRMGAELLEYNIDTGTWRFVIDM